MNDKGITYLRYGTPSPIGDAPTPKEMTKRSLVLLKYLKRNLNKSNAK